MIRHFLRAHGDLLVGLSAFTAGVILACVLGPTIDHQSTAKDGSGKTAYAAR